jgi:molybdopterin molybdotransferase
MKTTAQIAAALQGYDPDALPADQVQAFLAQLAEPIQGSQTLALPEALGRVLAHDLISPLSVPGHDNSAMDGYAFRGDQLLPGQPLALLLAGTALAGQPWTDETPAQACVKIMTGAMLPAGLDTVVPHELTHIDAAGRIVIAPGSVQAGAHVRRAGEDLMQGGVALQKGELLTPAALGLAASLGLESLEVRRRLRVAYFSTGDEILSLGHPPRLGAVYDSNRYTLCGLLQRLGAEVIDLGVVPDDPAQLQTAFMHAAQRADAVITSGGVSTGDADHTRTLMQTLGDVVFWRVAMRPGRPMAVGRIAGGAAGSSCTLFGLPGNPVAAMVTFLAFVRPALLRMMGARERQIPLLRARTTQPIRKRAGRTEYQRGIVTTGSDGMPEVRSTGEQGSGMLHSMVQANGLIVLPHAQESVWSGEFVDVMLLDGMI